MVESFMEGKFMTGKVEEEFLSYLASSMNTSVDQFKSVYIGLSTASYMDVATEMAQGLVRCLDDDVEERFGKQPEEASSHLLAMDSLCQ